MSPASLTQPLARLRRLPTEAIGFVLAAAMAAVFAMVVPGFASAANAENIARLFLPLLVVALGQMLVMLSGGIDLSQTSIIALSSVAGALVMNDDTGLLRGHALAVPAALLAMLLLGAVAGLANGLAVTRLGMPAFMVTLTSMMFLSGFAIWWTRSQNIAALPASFVAIGGRFLPALLITAGLASMVHLLLDRTLAGRWLYAVGQNPRAALVSGVPVRTTTVATYVASGMLAACAAVLFTGRLETASPVLGQRILLDVIGATVIGGTSLFGGRGKVPWTVGGVLFLAVLDNGLNLHGLSHFTIMMAKGAVILAAAGLDAWRQR